MRIWSIGHSSRSIETFVRMLGRIEVLVDIRTYPTSRHCPHFDGEALKLSLRDAGIAYRHFPSLGGRRGKQPGADPYTNAGWKNASFRNYADYTMTREYEAGIAELLRVASRWRTAYMCSERHPSKCHRLLVSNTLAARGHQVIHILWDAWDEDLEGEHDAWIEHEMGEWGAKPRVARGRVTYPSGKLAQLRLAL